MSIICQICMPLKKPPQRKMYQFEDNFINDIKVAFYLQELFKLVMPAEVSCYGKGYCVQTALSWLNSLSQFFKCEIL
ncbi:hypothetical protein V5799_032995 [Amblyomma americanum]|uniref:Uncharacterized protein n=1 Tax=Amblyomma americanum TaxID=6943 RepID=A0AAQ4DPK7_AMBAM